MTIPGGGSLFTEVTQQATMPAAYLTPFSPEFVVYIEVYVNGHEY